MKRKQLFTKDTIDLYSIGNFILHSYYFKIFSV